MIQEKKRENQTLKIFNSLNIFRKLLTLEEMPRL